MTNDISSNYVDITYTVDEIHAMSKLLYKVQEDSQYSCLLYTSPSPRDLVLSRMPSSA